MLRAMPLIRAKVPEARWIVVGDGVLRSYYERMAQTLGVRDVVHFLGPLSPTHRDRWLQGCDVFLMVSRDRKIDGGGEGFGIVYLEANAFAKPVVAGRAGGALDAVVDGVTGLLVDPENEVEVADAVVKLLTHPEWAEHLGRQGQERVRHDFTWEKTAAAVEAVLYSVAESASAGRAKGCTGE
jgi:phosphatidylinositol alpha-1,6-mannosyltransferase